VITCLKLLLRPISLERKIRDRIGCNSEKQLNNSQTLTSLEVENKPEAPYSPKRDSPRSEKIRGSFFFSPSPFSLQLLRTLARTKKNRNKIMEDIGVNKNGRTITVGRKT